MCFRMAESESIELLAISCQHTARTELRLGEAGSMKQLTTYRHPRGATMRPTSAGSSRSGPYGSCYGSPSARAQPQAFQRVSYLLRANFRFGAASLEVKNSTARQNRPAGWRIVFSADPSPGLRRATESSPSCAPDTPVARRGCDAVRSPSSNSCGKRVQRWSWEIPRLYVLPIRLRDLPHTRSDRRESLCREAVP